VVIGAETAEEHQLQRGQEQAPLWGMKRLRGHLPREVLWRRKTKLRLPRLLKKGGSPLHPEQRPLRQRAPLAVVKVQ